MVITILVYTIYAYFIGHSKKFRVIIITSCPYKVSREVKLDQISVGTMVMTHLYFRHYKGRSTLSPMLIRVSPLFDYFNRCEDVFSVLIARCLLCRQILNGRILL